MLVQSHYEFDIRVRRKAEALVAAGYSVDVLALRGNNPKVYTLNGVSVCTVSLGKKRGALARYTFEYATFFLWACAMLTFRMPQRRYDVIDVNTLPDFLVFAAIFAKWMGAKLVLDMHEITPEFYMSKYGISENSWWIWLLKFQERISFRFADHVITINEPILKLLTDRGLSLEKSTVIMNSVDESRFLGYPKESAANGISEGKFVMMYHGTLTRLYGLDMAIEAFALAHDQMPGAELWILGSGTESENLKRLAAARGLASKVCLVGQVMPNEIPDWLDKAAAGILPIRRDIFLEFASPNKLPEFIVMGKPVIISRLRAIRHYFGEDALAYFEPNSPDDLAKQMTRVYRDKRLCARLVATARREYEPIRWDVMKKRYLALIEELIGGTVREDSVPLATMETTCCKDEPSLDTHTEVRS